MVARLVLIPPGALAAAPLWVRLVALGGGVAGFYAIRRSAFAGVLIGEQGALPSDLRDALRRQVVGGPRGAHRFGLLGRRLVRVQIGRASCRERV